MLGRLAAIVIAAQSCGAAKFEPVPIYNDPQLVLPRDLWVTSGIEADVYLYHLALDNNAAITYTYSFSGPAGTLTSDHWAWTPSATGDSVLSVALTGGGRKGASTMTVHVGDGVHAATKVLLIGDSMTNNASYACQVAAGLTGETMLGTQNTGGCVQEGYSGQTWQWFATDPASPMTNAGGVIDIPSYLTAIGATPDVVVWHLGRNDFYALSWPGSEGQWDVTVNTVIESYIQPLLTAWHAAAPTVVHAIMLIPSGSSNATYWSDAGFDQYLWQRQKQAFNRKLVERYGGATAQGIYILPTNVMLDRANYADYVHPNSSGYLQFATEVIAWIKAVR